MIELWLVVDIQPDIRVIRQHAQQEPFLLLADADGILTLADKALRQAIAQPATRGGEHLHGLGHQADFLVKLAIKGLLGGFSRVDTSLWKLPGIAAAYPARPQHLTPVVRQEDAYICAETL